MFRFCKREKPSTKTRITLIDTIMLINKELSTFTLTVTRCIGKDKILQIERVVERDDRSVLYLPNTLLRTGIAILIEFGFGAIYLKYRLVI
jgi:hypothetical protein